MRSTDFELEVMKIEWLVMKIKKYKFTNLVTTLAIYFVFNFFYVPQEWKWMNKGK